MSNTFRVGLLPDIGAIDIAFRSLQACVVSLDVTALDHMSLPSIMAELDKVRQYAHLIESLTTAPLDRLHNHINRPTSRAA